MENNVMQTNENTEKKKEISLDAVIYTVLSGLGILFLFLRGFFKYWYHYEGVGEDSYFTKGNFRYLMNQTNVDVLFVILIITALAAIVACVWIGFFLKKRIKVVNIVCSAVSLGMVAIGTLAGALTFDHYSSNYSDFWGIRTYTDKVFISLQPLFYLELIVLAALLVLSILNEKGKFIIKIKK